VSLPTSSSAGSSVTTRLAPAFSAHFTPISILLAVAIPPGRRCQFSLSTRRTCLSWKSPSKANRSRPPRMILPPEAPPAALSRSIALTTRGGGEVWMASASKYACSPHMSSNPTWPAGMADMSRRMAMPQAAGSAANPTTKAMRRR
jgi:hypothetical protein